MAQCIVVKNVMRKDILIKMAKTNSWYVLAKEDKRYKYDFHSVLDRSHVFKDRKKAIEARKKRQPFSKCKLVILRRTCKKLEI